MHYKSNYRTSRPPAGSGSKKCAATAHCQANEQPDAAEAVAATCDRVRLWSPSEQVNNSVSVSVPTHFPNRHLFRLDLHWVRRPAVSIPPAAAATQGACMKSSFSRVQLCDPMDCSWPGSSVHGILQARILMWVAMPSSRGSFQLWDQTRVSCIAGRFFTS